jgi:hypothetical protein
MEAILAAAAGWLAGTVFSAQRGVIAAIALSVVMCVVSLLAMAVFADVVLGAKTQPAWVGFASLCFAVAFFFSCRKKSDA